VEQNVTRARESILRLVGEGPRRWAELQNALGLLTNEAKTACEWLMDHSYIAPLGAPMTPARLQSRSTDVLWTLGDRGQAWARRNGMNPS
jgi:hypothetical protein